jgi:hypothetical protein
MIKGEALVKASWMGDCPASALVSSSKNFRKVMGYKDLWMLKANLQPNEQNLPIAEEVKVG